MVKKKITKQHPGIMAAAISLMIMTLTGCGADQVEEPAGSDVQSSAGEIQQEELESGKVELKVWAE